jgi:predicted tellurium resistance membrane protein TerC
MLNRIVQILGWPLALALVMSAVLIVGSFLIQHWNQFAPAAPFILLVACIAMLLLKGNQQGGNDKQD